MNVFDQKLYEVGEHCYAIAASVHEPHLYGRFKCVVTKRDVKNDNISYYLRILEVCESDDWIKEHLHRKEWRLFHIGAERGQIKEFNCFDLLLNMSTFQKRFSEKFKHWVLVVPSVHTAETKESATELCCQTITIMKDRIIKDLESIKQREKQMARELDK
jgi:hypothetical protein